LDHISSIRREQPEWLSAGSQHPQVPRIERQNVANAMALGENDLDASRG